MSTPPLKMRNIGPKSAAWLRQVGLRTPEDLAEAGPLEAFMRVKRAGFKPSLNLLYALEGALQDCHWKEVDRKSTRLNSKSLMRISYAVFCLKKKNTPRP